MKLLIYITGVAGGIFLILRIVGIYVDFAYNDHLLAYGVFLVIVCLTLGSVYKYMHNQKIRNILRKYRESSSPETADREVRKTEMSEGSGVKQEKEDGDNDDKKLKSGSKGMEPGKTSLRERKTGLVWGGGNIKGANATRGTKRGFIKRW